MSLLKATRKIKRVGKTAVQFRITSTFEFIELQCKGTWRPENLRVIWLRNHRKVKSNDTTWTVSEDFGPNGAKGRAVFNPAISVSLVVTLYRDAQQTEFDEKEYKYHVEHEGAGGKKILATFNCNVAEFVGIPTTRHALDLNFKCVSKKVSEVKLGITLETQFVKEGGALDDDMQSTFSAMSAGQDSVAFDEEDDDFEEGGGESNGGGGGVPTTVHSSPSQSGNRRRLNTLQEESEHEIATISNGTQGASTASGSPKTVESNDTHVAPPNPVEADGVEVDIMVTKPSPTETWLDQEARLVDCFNDTVSREKLEQADIIGLYFSAGWCPPCRRFLPKLVKFYHHLKQHSKSFEIVYVSSDYSEQDMMKYMKEQQMPWVGIAYEGNISEDFRKSFNISAVPLLKILTRKGYSVEDSAKKSVESASSGSAILKLYNKWHEKMVSESTEEEGRITATGKEKKGLLSKVKATIGSKEKQRPQDSEQIVSELQTHDSSPPRSPEHEAGRRVVDTRQTRTKSKVGKGALTQELLDEKDERIHHLEEVNRTLKQTNDEQAEELGELRAKLQLLTTELNQLKSTSKTLQEESKELIANLNMRGWLFKRGVRGPTANIWRRRYFRLDQGSKLYYYKNSSEGNPQGYIDMDKVLTVQEVTPSQQDKNHSTFTVQCDGRTFQLQAHDEPSMRKWMEAILYMVSWRKKNSRAIAEDLA